MLRSLAVQTVTCEQFLYFLDESNPDIHAIKIINVVPSNLHMWGGWINYSYLIHIIVLSGNMFRIFHETYI